jgi:hypothetical protein
MNSEELEKNLLNITKREEVIEQLHKAGDAKFSERVLKAWDLLYAGKEAVEEVKEAVEEVKEAVAAIKNVTDKIEIPEVDTAKVTKIVDIVAEKVKNKFTKKT